MCSREAHRRSGSYYNRKAAAVILRLPHILRNVVCMTCFARARARARASIARRPRVTGRDMTGWGKSQIKLTSTR